MKTFEKICPFCGKSFHTTFGNTNIAQHCVLQWLKIGNGEKTKGANKMKIIEPSVEKEVKICSVVEKSFGI